MTTTFIIIYLIIIPGLCVVLGFLLGKRYGYNQRTNELLRDQLFEAKASVEELNETWERLKTSLFMIQSAKKSRPKPLSLQERLENALAEEDYETAAQIRNLINSGFKDE